MEGYRASSYGDGFADVYDRWYPDVTDTGACVALLATLVPAGGRVLELGVGTGRLAIPLAGDGLEVVGVDASAAMLDRLAAKPGGDAVSVVLGDMADLSGARPPLPPERRFDLAFVAYNTLFNLADVAGQERAVHGVAERLVPGGRFVVEGFVPAEPVGAPGDPDRVSVSRIDPDELVLTATVHDPEAQTVTGQHVQITEAGIRLRPWGIRYLRPDQLDAVAGRAGLVLEDRWSDWHRTPFDEHSATQVAVYVRPS
jgi:SAM-dependent methyltransferase